ncbi:MAG: hypothetical protein HQ568_00835 [Calditrichaeota bacterium]|nr:hypothetical protein [Calditrichota bacterium]
MRIIFCISLVFTFFTVSCMETSNESPDYIYPLEVGNTWIYDRSMRFSEMNGNTINESYSVIQSEITEIDQLDNNITAYRIHTREVDDSNYVSEGDGWYNHRSDGLYCFAYSGSGWSGSPCPPPRDEGITRYRFKGRIFSSPQEIIRLLTDQSPLFGIASDDSITYEDPPVCCIKYPPEVGTEWIYRDYDNPFLIVKRITGRHGFESHVGVFDCILLRWFYDFDENGEFDTDITVQDYYANEGLIRQVIDIDSIEHIDELGNILGYSNIFEDIMLQSYNLK